MKKLIAAHLAVFAVTLAGSASAADLAIKAPAPVAAPFNWTGCYIGVHVGGGVRRTTSPTRCNWSRTRFWVPALRPV